MRMEELRNTGVGAIWHSEKLMRRYKRNTAVCFPPSAGSANKSKRYDPWNTTAKNNPKVEDWSVKLRKLKEKALKLLAEIEGEVVIDVSNAAYVAVTDKGYYVGEGPKPINGEKI